MRAYLELVRPANVLTALADVLAGYAVAGSGHSAALPWLLASTACLYAGGIGLNDVMDRRLDATERPERPIPSGRVSFAKAAALVTVLLAAGVTTAAEASLEAGAIAVGIVILVVTYNGWAKRHLVFGPVTMAGCRALNFLLGVAAVTGAVTSRWPFALLPFVYIGSVTLLSRGEVHGGSRSIAGVALAGMGGVLSALVMIAGRRPLALVLTALLAWRVAPPFWHAARETTAPTIRRAIKAGVLSLVLLDAALAAIYAEAVYALVIVALAFAAQGLARAFAVT